MKGNNMDRLVNFLDEYLKNGDELYSPTNIQYDFYTNIFIDEIENGDCHHIDRFSEELANHLIKRGLEPTGNLGGNKIDQHKRYDEFYKAWYNWCIIFSKLKKAGLLI